MANDRSTPTAGPEGYAASPKSPQQFARTTAHTMQQAVFTPLEKFAMNGSDPLFNSLAGAAGGLTSGIITCPLDVIKTKLQAQGGFRAQARQTRQLGDAVYSGMLGTARYIWREEGLRGMYRGLTPIILGYLPTWAVWFTIYGESKEYFGKYSDNPNVINFGSSIVAGGISTLVTNPIWVIKTRLMAQVSRRSQSNGARPPWHYSSTFDAARKMYQTEGFLSFYSGLTPALLGLTHVAVQFPAYEYLKTKFTGQGMGVHGDGSERSHWLGILSASVLSKILASSATYPHEVIRTRLQTQLRSIPPVLDSHGVPKTPNIGQTVGPKYKGIVTTFKTILREEGWRAFYAGMGTNMMRAVPAATTTLLTYEYVSSNLQHIKRDALHRAGKADGEDW